MGTGSFRKIKPTKCWGITTSVRVYRGGSRNLEMTKVTEKVGAISNHLKTKRPLKQDSIRMWRKGALPQFARSAHG